MTGQTEALGNGMYKEEGMHGPGNDNSSRPRPDDSILSEFFCPT